MKTLRLLIKSLIHTVELKCFLTFSESYNIAGFIVQILLIHFNINISFIKTKILRFFQFT